MIIVFQGREQEFKTFKQHLDSIGLSYEYHYRKNSGSPTQFSLDISHIDLASLRLLKDFVEQEYFQVKFIQGNREYNLIKDYSLLSKEIEQLEKKGRLTREYHH